MKRLDICIDDHFDKINFIFEEDRFKKSNRIDLRQIIVLQSKYERLCF